MTWTVVVGFLAGIAGALFVVLAIALLSRASNKIVDLIMGGLR